MTAMTAAREQPNPTTSVQTANAVTWITPYHAVVARRLPGGEVRLQTLERRPAFEDEEQFFVRVSLDTGPAAHVIVLGPVLDRVRFERVDVAIHGRPERLIDSPTDVFEAPTVADVDPLLKSPGR